MCKAPKRYKKALKGKIGEGVARDRKQRTDSYEYRVVTLDVDEQSLKVEHHQSTYHSDADLSHGKKSREEGAVGFRLLSAIS